jgi:Sigma-70 region 2
MDGEAELIDRAGPGAVGAYEKVSTPPLPDATRLAHRVPRDHCAAEDCVKEAATPGWQRLQNRRLKPLFPSIVPQDPAETMQDSAVRSLREVSREPMVDERELDLIRLVLLGDTGAYDGLLTPHLPIAARLACSQVRDHSRAQDCVQEAAIRGWSRLENLKPRRLQRLIDDANARCWLPDPPSRGPCQIT